MLSKYICDLFAAFESLIKKQAVQDNFVLFLLVHFFLPMDVINQVACNERNLRQRNHISKLVILKLGLL